MTTIICNISKAAETKTVSVSGVPTLVTNFNIAENYTNGAGEKAVQFYRVSIWRDKGAKLEKYLTKGRPLSVTGRIRGRAYLDAEGKPQCQLELVNPQITFVTANPAKEAEAQEPVDLPENEQPF